MNPLQQKLDINNERYRIIVSIKEDYLDGKLSLEEGNRILKEKLGTCTPDEFAYAEQSLKGVYKDEEILDKMDDLLNLFDGVLVRAENEYPENHPLWAYLEEINAVEKVALEADELLKQDKFIKNPWLGVFDSLAEWRIHLSRKQNQLYPMLENHGFDRPTRIMWTFDDGVRDAISASYALLREDKYEEFLASVPETLAKLRDLNSKELEVLLPTSFKLLSDEEFVRISKNDHEIGYAIINAPGLYVVTGINDSAAQLNTNNSGQNGAVSADRPAGGGHRMAYLSERGLSGIPFCRYLFPLAGVFPDCRMDERFPVRPVYGGYAAHPAVCRTFGGGRSGLPAALFTQRRRLLRRRPAKYGKHLCDAPGGKRRPGSGGDGEHPYPQGQGYRVKRRLGRQRFLLQTDA